MRAAVAIISGITTLLLLPTLGACLGAYGAFRWAQMPPDVCSMGALIPFVFGGIGGILGLAVGLAVGIVLAGGFFALAVPAEVEDVIEDEWYADQGCYAEPGASTSARRGSPDPAARPTEGLPALRNGSTRFQR
jgi:hypothetical protein